ncbi:MAG: hypothetical protein KF775_13245 [Cyclobacteriaceae bacterium]|nr:hypothetical protein [Cyclobacteriaceae bacterium]
MKKGRFQLIVGLMLLAPFTYGQDYAFRVLASKGSNEIKTAEGWQPVKTGASLKLGDELKVSENASVGLVHNSGKPLEVKVAKTYKVIDLQAQVSGNSSVLNKYTDFILSSNSAEAKKNRMSATGAVHRGLAGAIYPLLPGNQSGEIFGNQLVVNWETDSKGPYQITILNMFDEPIYKTETADKTVTVNLADAKFSGEDALLIDIRSKATGAKIENESRPMVKRLSQAKSEKIKTGYAELTKELDTNTAFGSLFLAGFYEQNGLLVDAIAAYEHAIALAPDDPTYKEYYLEFLYRNKIKEDPAAKKQQ